jgi:uncharacterized protein
MDMMDLQKTIGEIRNERGFTTDPIKIFALLAEEIGEVAKELKKTWSKNYAAFDRDMLAEEIVDVQICLIALANCYDIDISKETTTKFIEKDKHRNWKTSAESTIPESQHDALICILEESEVFRLLMETLYDTRLENWYLTAGFIQQIVFNYFHGYDLHQNIKDIDVVYYALEKDAEYERSVITAISDSILTNLEIDLRNEAFVHEWYQEKFGYSINRYSSIHDAIDSFPTTTTAIGITIKDGNYRVHSTFGYDDLFNLILRPNKRQITKEIYETKTARIMKNWPKVRVVEW